MNRIEWDIFHVAEVIVALFLWLFPAFLLFDDSVKDSGISPQEVMIIPDNKGAVICYSTINNQCKSFDDCHLRALCWIDT